ncbi:MAG: hypothetical protein HC887_12100 [Desulfobacteraceae bacterium]|nr:hypothetical protein [Desulfobacteraceae bacterium]
MQSEFSSSLSSFSKIFWSRFQERPIRYISWYLFEKPYYFWSWNILVGQGDVYIYEIKKSLYQTSAAANFTREIMKFSASDFIDIGSFGNRSDLEKISFYKSRYGKY